MPRVCKKEEATRVVSKKGSILRAWRDPETGKDYWRKESRWMWEIHKGEIPKGCDIHHKDLDSTNNNISNLEIMTKEEHQSLHGKKPEIVMEIEGVLCRLCPKCEGFYPKTEEYFYDMKKGSKFSGLICKFCSNKRSSERYYNKIEEIKKYQKKYRESHKEYFKKYREEYKQEKSKI